MYAFCQVLCLREGRGRRRLLALLLLPGPGGAGGHDLGVHPAAGHPQHVRHRHADPRRAGAGGGVVPGPDGQGLPAPGEQPRPGAAGAAAQGCNSTDVYTGFRMGFRDNFMVKFSTIL